MPPRHVVFAVLPGAQLLDLAGPAEVFAAANECARRAGGEAGYRLTFAGLDADVDTATGVQLRLRRLRQVRGSIDTLVVPGGGDFAHSSFDPRAIRWIRKRAERARRVASVCTGAFVLARAGLLGGRRATTHWTALEALREQVPSASVEGDPLYIKDGPIYTSAGISAGIDLGVALVEEDHGHERALEVARALVMFLHRPGGQSQYSVALQVPAASHPGIRSVQAEVVEHPGGDHRVAELAGRAGVSPRHFVRLFTEQTGEAPSRYVQRVRIERARQLLERGAHSVDEVAEACGFGTAETMRRGFQRAVGVSPSEYRARFAWS